VWNDRKAPHDQPWNLNTMLISQNDQLHDPTTLQREVQRQRKWVGQSAFVEVSFKVSSYHELTIVFDAIYDPYRQMLLYQVTYSPVMYFTLAPILLQLIIHKCVVRERPHDRLQLTAVSGAYELRDGSRKWKVRHLTDFEAVTQALSFDQSHRL